MSFILIFGKELRADPQRGMRELHARAAGAAALWRRRGGVLLALEARLRGQGRSGSALVAEMLAGHGVPAGAIRLEDRTCSTREEVVRALEIAGSAPIVGITSAYHVERARRLFAEHGRAAPVHAPESLWRMASEEERARIRAGIPGEEAWRRERRQERALSLLEAGLVGLPVGLRARVEVAAGRLWRGG